jgi:arylesterase / paraoxonase
MKKALKIGLLLLLIVSILVLKSVYQSGSFKTIKNNFSGTTQHLNGMAGVEDITIDQATGIAFFSSDDRWAGRNGKPVKGTIYMANLNDSVVTPLSITTNFPQADFHPHGISLFSTPEGKKILFVVNHRESSNCVEIFAYKNDSLQHLETISDALLISPNDIVGVGERAFYITNDHDEKASKSRYIKDLAQIGMGNVCYFDGQKMQKTGIEGVKYANGINKSADGKKIYLARTSAKKISLYDRDITTGALTLADEIDTDTGVDNIELDAEGNLWVGCHPQMLKFLAHAKDEKALSPSEIIKITYKGKGQFEQKTVYLNDGSDISASSVAAVYKDKLLIGPVFQHHVVLGKMR